MKKGKSTLDRTTVHRTIVNVRKAILDRLRQLKKSRHWLAEQIDVRPATVYDFLKGTNPSAAKVGMVEEMLSVLGLEIRPKGKRHG